MQETTDLFTITSEEAGIRLDKLLASRFSQYSRTYFQYLIEQGCVLVNGEIWKKREKPDEDDEIEVCFQLTPEISLEPENIPLDILYEDPYLIAVNKPAGMVVHPAPGHPSGTFVNALLFHCRGLQGTDPLRPGIVHRLDKDTSGILLAAKTSEAHQRLVKLFSERKIEKTYLAIAIGKVTDGLIDSPIGRHPVHRKEMAISPQGKEAKTFCRLINYCEGLSLVELKLITGRTHQIRVHLKSRGTPVLGDPVYGSDAFNQKFKATRQLLHASQVHLTHPMTQEPIQILAPLPSDFSAFLKNFSEPNP
jgi:23S rRNA pseudouridine1911/1915/1917 synthase